MSLLEKNARQRRKKKYGIDKPNISEECKLEMSTNGSVTGRNAVLRGLEEISARNMNKILQMIHDVYEIPLTEMHSEIVK